MFKVSNPENDHALIYAPTAPCCEAKVSSRLGGSLDVELSCLFLHLEEYFLHCFV